MAWPPGRDDRRALAVAVAVGLVHAAAIAALVARLDYPVDALATAPGGRVGALVGLVALVAVPAFVAVRGRLLLPLAAVVLVAGRSVGLALTTPPPEFSTLGGHLVVHGPRYVDGYVDAWYVWLFAALLLGLAESVARVDHDRLAAPARSAWLDRGLDGDGRLAFVAVGVAHAGVFLGLAADWGYFAPGGFLPAPWYVGLGVLGWTLLGLVAIGGVPALLLARWRLVTPTVGLAWLAWRTRWLQQLPLPDDPLPVYFLGWFVFAGALAGLGGLEYAGRRAWRRYRRAGG
ncbi:MAG: hypothetical protein ABEJ92_08135 [Halobacteriales archaeon]